MSVLTTAIASFALAAGAVAAVPATAAVPFEQPVNVTVRYADLDLSSPRDVARLNRRVVNAAKFACGAFDVRDLAGVEHIRSCRTRAIANALPTVEQAIAQASQGNRLAAALPAGTISAR